MRFTIVFLNVFILFISTFCCHSQVGIGTTNPSEKATLEVSSQIDGMGDYMGLMISRVPDESARDLIATTPIIDKGLTVFVVATGCLDIFNGQEWEHINCAAPGISVVSSNLVWINEIHYANVGVDVDEFIELAGRAGQNLTGFRLVLYNGADGDFYRNINLTGTIPDQSNGYGVLPFFINIQNGNPDGIALIDPTGNVMQFLSYGGDFTAMNNIAVGITSTDIGVSEDGSDVPGSSLQLKNIAGVPGSSYSDFEWVTPSTASPGLINTGQTFN